MERYEALNDVGSWLLYSNITTEHSQAEGQPTEHKIKIKSREGA
jgi:hypothetical protein